MVQKKMAKGVPLKQAGATDFKFLIVIRHGDYDDNHNLSPFGVNQIEKLSDRLNAFIDGSKILLLSSPAPRAFQSAKIISTKLNTPVEEHEILWSDNYHLENFNGLLEIIRKRKSEAEIIILMTHLEYVEGFPAHFASKELGMQTAEAPMPSKGEACLVDCTNKRFQLISYC